MNEIKLLTDEEKAQARADAEWCVVCHKRYGEDEDRGELHVYPDSCTAHDECWMSEAGADTAHWSACVMSTPALPRQGIAVVPQIPTDSWLWEDRFADFRKAYTYAATQTNAIPALAQLAPEQAYHLYVALKQGDPAQVASEADRLRDRVHELELSLRRVCGERDEARAEAERLREAYATQVTAIRAHLDELERLREVLRFYADLGKRARKALGEET